MNPKDANEDADETSALPLMFPYYEFATAIFAKDHRMKSLSISDGDVQLWFWSVYGVIVRARSAR